MKRMICVLLALIMLLSVMPLSASAAGMSVSENAITVLKNLQRYNGNTCVQVGNEFRTGYGTICTTCTKAGELKAHTYSEKKADADLRTKLAELSTAVNSFASSNSVTLNQNKFDALVLLSYDIGTAWLSGDGVLKSAVVNGLTGNAFLNAIGQSSALGSDPTDTVTGKDRRMVEGNMYLNGTYTDVTPKNYSWVKYDAKGGTMAEGKDGIYTQYFDANIAATPAPVPTRTGYTFLGWYMENGTDTITWVPALAGWQVGGKTLEARWQPAGTDYTAALGTSSPKVYNWLAPKAIASKDIYDKPNGTVTDTHTADKVMIDRDWIDAKGNRWGHLLSGGNGWVLVSGVSNNKFDVDVTVTVTNSTLNGRANSNAASKLIKTFSKGDQLRIISTETTAYKLWGQVADEKGTPICWVCLMYTNWNEVKDKAPTNSNNSSNTKAIAKAVVNCEGYLNVRSAAGTDNAIVGALADGDHVEIFEIKFVNGHQWGRTTGGWILLTYAKVEMVEGNNATFTNTKDVLAYTFTGKLDKDVIAYTDATTTSATVGSTIKSGTTVAVSMIKNGEGGVWGFNGVGWIQLKDIKMDEAKYVVVSDGLSVREGYANDARQVEKVSKGVELNISNLAVVDATIWGYTAKYDGWVNLASKFVKRSNAPVIENVSGNVKSNWVATIVNTDNVNVRATDTATSARLGGLSRGTEVRVWDNNGEGGEPTWYKVDSNQNGIYDEDGDGWVAAQYLSIDWKPMDQDAEETEENNSNSSSTSKAVETGLGIVANTYSGVNIRAGAGTGYASTGKYLNGTAVEILEVTSTATSKWGRTVKGWVCMDYVNMVNKYPIGGAAAEDTTSSSPNPGGSTSTTEGNTTFTSTPVSYTGRIAVAEVELKKTADEDAIVTSTLSEGANITLQELRKVTTKVTASAGEVIDGNGSTESITVTTSTTYWARTNGGWIQNPAGNIALDALEETVYTNVGESDVDVFTDVNGSRVTSISKNTQVTITSVKIAEDKVWGFIEDIGTAGGWVRLDRLAQGAHKVAESNTNNSTSNNNGANNGGNNFTLGTGGDTTGAVPTGGYRYTGKIINTSQVNVRSIASTSGKVTTTLKAGGAVVIYETTINPEDLSAWGRCDAGWVHLYYVDLVPATSDGAVDARVVQQDNAIYYSDSNATNSIGTYAKGSVIDIYEIVGTMARTKLGWVSINDLLN